MTGITTINIIQYRDWRVEGSSLFYNNELVGTIIHNVFLLSDKVKFLIPVLVKLNECFFIIDDFDLKDNDGKTFIHHLFSRFTDAAYKNYFLKKSWFRIVKASDYKFEDKYLIYCTKMSYSQFCEVKQKHRLRYKPENESLHGLWYR